MDLQEKTLELLQEKQNCASVIIVSSKNKEYPLGTVLVVTSNNYWGDYPVLKDELVYKARTALKDKKSHLETLEEYGIEVYFDIILSPEELLIVGAGHIAVILCKMASILGFKVSVIDDRQEFVSEERFPTATNRYAGNFVEVLQNLEFNSNMYVVLVTRGHVHDRDCLRVILQHDVAYIGVICSQRRKQITFDLLRQAGYTEEQIKNIFAPIGLPIGGETPEDISLSILSEIMAVKYRGKEWVLNIKDQYGFKKSKNEQ